MRCYQGHPWYDRLYTTKIRHKDGSSDKWGMNVKISPLFWNRYVDDTFTIIHNKDSANEFLHYLNSCHSNIKFTIELEQNNAIPFLDILVTRNQNNTFMTFIYRKKTFTGFYMKWDSFTPRKYKINLIRSLTYRYYRLCSSGSLLQSALNDLRKLLLQNGYPRGIINYHINDVLNKNRQHQHSNPVSTVPKKGIVILLPYLGLQSNQVAKRPKSCVYKFYSCVNLKIVFQSTRCIKIRELHCVSSYFLLQRTGRTGRQGWSRGSSGITRDTRKPRNNRVARNTRNTRLGSMTHSGYYYLWQMKVRICFLQVKKIESCTSTVLLWFAESLTSENGWCLSGTWSVFVN